MVTRPEIIDAQSSISQELQENINVDEDHIEDQCTSYKQQNVTNGLQIRYRILENPRVWRIFEGIMTGSGNELVSLKASAFE